MPVSAAATAMSVIRTDEGPRQWMGRTMFDLPFPEDPFLRAALGEAILSYREGGVPIGSVLVHDGKIIGRGRNRRVQDGNPILHAEMACYQNAGRLPASAYRDCTLYSTLSPCYMCSGTTLLFGVPRVIVGENRAITGAGQWLRAECVSVTMLNDGACRELLQRFIREKPDIWREDIGHTGRSALRQAHDHPLSTSLTQADRQ
jgi:creatinine deaminase